MHAEAYADGVLLDSFDTAVDCAPPNHIVVSKTVVGGTGNPAFPFEVVCHPAGSPESSTVVSTFNLHDGESKSVDLPNPNDLPYCNARELDPGPAWTVTESFNGVTHHDSSFDELSFPNDMNYTLDVTNTAVVEPTTTTSTTSTTTTTIPVAVSSEDAAAIPVGTTAPRPLTQSEPPAAIADPTPATNLAQTGSDTSSTLLAGLGLLLAGLVVVGATRRSRRRAA